MSDFDDMEAALSRAVSETFADKATHIPRLVSTYSDTQPDPFREEQTICGVLSQAVMVDNALKSWVGPGINDATLASEFWIEAANVPAELPKKGDALSFPDLPDAPVFKIARIDPTDRGDLNCIMTRE